MESVIYKAINKLAFLFSEMMVFRNEKDIHLYRFCLNFMFYLPANVHDELLSHLAIF